MCGGQGRDVRAVLGCECPVLSGDRAVSRGDPEILGRVRAIRVANRVILGGTDELRCCHFGALVGHRKGCIARFGALRVLSTQTLDGWTKAEAPPYPSRAR